MGKGAEVTSDLPATIRVTGLLSSASEHGPAAWRDRNVFCSGILWRRFGWPGAHHEGAARHRVIRQTLPYQRETVEVVQRVRADHRTSSVYLGCFDRISSDRDAASKLGFDGQLDRSLDLDEVQDVIAKLGVPSTSPVVRSADYQSKHVNSNRDSPN